MFRRDRPFYPGIARRGVVDPPYQLNDKRSLGCCAGVLNTRNRPYVFQQSQTVPLCSGLAPTEIIYRIAMRFLLGFDDGIVINNHHLRRLDALACAKDGTLGEKIEDCLDTLTLIQTNFC